MKIAAALLILLIIIAFIPFEQQAGIGIQSNYFDVCRQFTTADNWKHWQPDIKGDAGQGNLTLTQSGFLISIPGQTFEVQHLSADRFKVVRTIHHIDYSYAFTVLPNVANNHATVLANAQINVGKWLMAKLNPSADILDIPLAIKNFMENSGTYYGFSIRQKYVHESYFAVKKQIVLSKNKYAAMAKATKELHDFLSQNNLQQLQALSGACYTQNADSLRILIGIPVNKQVNSTGGISFMHMPKGKWLVGDYKGKYGNRRQLYNAMEKYMQDHSLSQQIAPIETYLDNRPPANDDDTVNMQLNYPMP